MHNLTEIQVFEKKKLISETICNKKLDLNFFSQGITTITTITKIQMTWFFFLATYLDTGIYLYLRSI